jgi:hypothetical protein
MRRCTVSIAILLLAMMSLGTALAEEEKPKGKGKVKSPILVDPAAEKTPEELGRRKRIGSAEAKAERRKNREEMARGMLHAEQLRKLDDQIEEKRGQHDKFIGELKAIKELALQEKAEKTAERLQGLIDKHTGLFNEDVRKLEQRRDRIREQAEKQAQERLKRKERLMERRKEVQEKVEAKGITGKGKGKGQGPGKSKAGAQDQDED